MRKNRPAIQHCHSTSLVTSLCLVLTKNDQGYSEGSGVTDLLPLLLPSSILTHKPQGLPLPLLLPTCKDLYTYGLIYRLVPLEMKCY